MCIKSIYHNTYGDGTHDITERVESCTPGYMCANPRIVEYDREFKLPRREAKLSQKSRPGHATMPASPVFFPPTPRSMSPANSPARRSSNLETPAFGIHARPIPIRRSSGTRPHGTETPPLDRGRRPVVVEDHGSRKLPNSASPAPVVVQEHASSDRLRRRRSQRSFHSSTDDTLRRSSSARRRPALVIDDAEDNISHRHHHRTDRADRADRAERSPIGYGSAEDEREERHRRHRAAHDLASVKASSLPVYGNADVLSSSYESSAVSSSDASATAVKKELRWEDEQRLKHNARISMRPKLERSETAKQPLKLERSETLKPTPKAQPEVKSILKNGNNNNNNIGSGGPTAPSTPVEGRSATSSSPRTPQRSTSRASSRGRRSSMSASPDRHHHSSSSDLEDVFSSFSGLGIHGRSDSPAGHHSEDTLDREYRNRLRSRFNMPPPRRHTSNNGFRQRTEVWYPEERRYRFV